MTVETATTLAELVDTLPAETDPIAEGGAHLRLIKAVLKLDAVSQAQLSALQARTIQKFLTGSGIYTTPANCVAIRVRMVGGGGGGGGGDIGGQTAGGTGGATTFGTALLTAYGGTGGREGNILASQPSGGLGGAISVNSPAVSTVSMVGNGGGSGTNVIVATYAMGGYGAPSALGGAPYGHATGTGIAGTANSGSGGGGGGTYVGNGQSGAGGGSGGFIDALINSPSATYAYSIGTGGTAGAIGTSGSAVRTGSAGGAGGSGVIIVEEYYV